MAQLPLAALARAVRAKHFAAAFYAHGSSALSLLRFKQRE